MQIRQIIVQLVAVDVMDDLPRLSARDLAVFPRPTISIAAVSQAAARSADAASDRATREALSNIASLVRDCFAGRIAAPTALNEIGELGQGAMRAGVEG